MKISILRNNKENFPQEYQGTVYIYINHTSTKRKYTK